MAMASPSPIGNEFAKQSKSSSSFNKEIIKRIFDVDSKKCLSLSSYTFVDIISELKPVFLNNDEYGNTHMPTLEYIHFMKYILSILEVCSCEQLKTIERFCIRMDEDALTGIVKYHDKIDGYITRNGLSHLLKKYKIDDNLTCEIIKRDHVNISNSLINILAKNIRINKPMCKYNSNCYRKNNEHLKTYLHYS
jgi:hypothetical protein